MFAVVSIGDVSGEQHEQDLRDELCKTSVSQRHRRMRPLIDLPSDRDFLHLPSEDQNHVPGKIPAEGGQSPDYISVMLLHSYCGSDRTATISHCTRAFPENPW